MNSTSPNLAATLPARSSFGMEVNSSSKEPSYNNLCDREENMVIALNIKEWISGWHTCNRCQYSGWQTSYDDLATRDTAGNSMRDATRKTCMVSSSNTCSRCRFHNLPYKSAKSEVTAQCLPSPCLQRNHAKQRPKQNFRLLRSLIEALTTRSQHASACSSSPSDDSPTMPEDPLNPIHPHPQALLLAVWIADGDVASERAFAKAIQALS